MGFALETKDVKKEAARKRKAKNCDLVIGNTTASFGSGRIRAYWCVAPGTGAGRARWLPVMSKEKLADKIVKFIAQQRSSGVRPQRGLTPEVPQGKVPGRALWTTC